MWSGLKKVEYLIFDRQWRFYPTDHTIFQGLLSLWMFYSDGDVTFQ